MRSYEEIMEQYREVESTLRAMQKEGISVSGIHVFNDQIKIRPNPSGEPRIIPGTLSGAEMNAFRKRRHDVINWRRSPTLEAELE